MQKWSTCGSRCEDSSIINVTYPCSRLVQQTRTATLRLLANRSFQRCSTAGSSVTSRETDPADVVAGRPVPDTPGAGSETDSPADSLWVAPPRGVVAGEFGMSDGAS